MKMKIVTSRSRSCLKKLCKKSKKHKNVNSLVKLGLLIGVISTVVIALVYKLVYVQIYLKTYRYYNPIAYNSINTISSSNSSSNYFVDTDDYAKKFGFIIKTPNCRILNISAWDPSILPFIERAEKSNKNPNCSENDGPISNKKWTFIDETNLIINQSAIIHSGYSLDSISCCYRVIKRLKKSQKQSFEDFKPLADTRIMIDTQGDCLPLDLNQNSDQNLIKIGLGQNHEFIRVLCKSKFWPFHSDIVYRYFHAIAQPHRSQETVRKIKFWSKKKSQRTPPNILLLGIDSMSRLSFERNMIQTRKYLQEIGAVEMLGYTKVGENTFPNAIAFLTGQLEDDLTKNGCLKGHLGSIFFDNCPFIWRNFSKINYLTALIEDVPDLATFNYLKLGFLNQPVDYYFRPFMISVNHFLGNMKYTLDCLGRDTVDQVLLNYVENLLKMSQKSHTPIFAQTWLTNLAHTNVVGGKYADKFYHEFLQKITKVDSNTIVFFFSDHGYRYGEIRKTFAGWMEDKLPNFWVYIPKSWKNYSILLKNLQINSKRLNSPLDLYKTLSHLLEEFSIEKPATITTTTIKDQTQLKSYSLLHEIIPENRKCSEAGISNNICACVIPKKINISNTDNFTGIVETSKMSHFKDKNPRNFLQQLGHNVVHFINSLVPRQCSALLLGKIMAGAILDPMDNEILTFVTTFSTQPGEFQFEATVDYFLKGQGQQNTQKLNISIKPTDILRINRINPKHTKCLDSAGIIKGNQDNPIKQYISSKISISNDLLERFCFCI